MSAPKPKKPLTRGGKVFVWLMIVFIVLLGLGGGVALIKDGMDSRAALTDGPSGTFTPTDRRCGKDSCTWIGDFVSHDGTVTRTDVELRDNVRLSRSDLMPPEIDDVRLHDDTDRPVAYTGDHNWGWSLAGGIAILVVVCLMIPVFLIRMLKRHQRQTT